MSVCVSVSPICATNEELNLVCLFVSSLSAYENHYLSASFDQPIKRVSSFSCDLVSSFSAYESILIYLEQSFHSYMIPMARSQAGQ